MKPEKKVEFRTIIIFLIIIVFASCVGETNCPGYSREYLNWIPYSRGEYMSFSNGKDTATFIIDEVSYSEPYSFKNTCKCACEANAYFSTQISTDININIRGESFYITTSELDYCYKLTTHEPIEGRYVAMSADDFYFSKESPGTSNEHISTFTVNNMEFQNVVEIELDTINDNSLNYRYPTIWKVHIADSIGLIQFEFFENKDVWKIIYR